MISSGKTFFFRIPRKQEQATQKGLKVQEKK
jgi:hypothetical protein